MERRDFLTGTALIGGAILTGCKNEDKQVISKFPNKPLSPLYVPSNNNSFVKIRYNQTNEQFSAVESIVPPKTMGPAPHVHKDLDEVCRVLKGTLTIMVDKEIFKIEAGGWHIRPHGIVHTFWNDTNEEVSFIDFYPNQDFEVFLELLVAQMKDFKNKNIDPDSKEARKILDELHARWGMVIYYDQRKPIMEKYGLV